MSHNVEHFTFPKDVNKAKVQKELDNYVAHADWQEGCSGLYNNIRWLDGKVYVNYDEAIDAIDKLDKGAYDQLAVLYYDVESVRDDKVKELQAKSDELWKEYERRDDELYVERVKAEFIGCKKCGSRLARKFLYTNFCPVCKNDFRSETALKSIEAAKARANKARTAVCDYMEKKAKRNVRWLVKIEYHT